MWVYGWTGRSRADQKLTWLTVATQWITSSWSWMENKTDTLNEDGQAENGKTAKHSEQLDPSWIRSLLIMSHNTSNTWFWYMSRICGAPHQNRDYKLARKIGLQSDGVWNDRANPSGFGCVRLPRLSEETRRGQSLSQHVWLYKKGSAIIGGSVSVVWRPPWTTC